MSAFIRNMPAQLLIQEGLQDLEDEIQEKIELLLEYEAMASSDHYRAYWWDDELSYDEKEEESVYEPEEVRTFEKELLSAGLISFEYEFA